MFFTANQQYGGAKRRRSPARESLWNASADQLEETFHVKHIAI
jgi:hypothetical protein